eukprot:SAG11_NODE_293_length_11144_cov_4.661928_8_plen_57_part_00
MTPWPIRVLYMDTTVSALIDALQETSFKGFPVVTNSEDHLVVGTSNDRIHAHEGEK